MKPFDKDRYDRNLESSLIGKPFSDEDQKHVERQIINNSGLKISDTLVDKKC